MTADMIDHIIFSLVHNTCCWPYNLHATLRTCDKNADNNNKFVASFVLHYEDMEPSNYADMRPDFTGNLERILKQAMDAAPIADDYGYNVFVDIEVFEVLEAGMNDFMYRHGKRWFRKNYPPEIIPDGKGGFTSFPDFTKEPFITCGEWMRVLA